MPDANRTAFRVDIHQDANARTYQNAPFINSLSCGTAISAVGSQPVHNNRAPAGRNISQQKIRPKMVVSPPIHFNSQLLAIFGSHRDFTTATILSENAFGRSKRKTKRQEKKYFFHSSEEIDQSRNKRFGSGGGGTGFT